MLLSKVHWIQIQVKSSQGLDNITHKQCLQAGIADVGIKPTVCFCWKSRTFFILYLYLHLFCIPRLRQDVHHVRDWQRARHLRADAEWLVPSHRGDQRWHAVQRHHVLLGGRDSLGDVSHSHKPWPTRLQFIHISVIAVMTIPFCRVITFAGTHYFPGC